MARRPLNAPIDLSTPHDLTTGLIDGLRCPAGRDQAFLRDLKSPGLRVRVTSNGSKSFVFESKVGGKTLRRTIGTTAAWTIDAARAEANRLRVLVDRKQDPRDLDREAAERKAAAAAAAAAQQAVDAVRATTVGDVWPSYMAEGKPRGKDAWKPRYRADLQKAADPGGKPKARGKGMTKPGHLAPLMSMPLLSIDADAVREWYSAEKRRAPVQAGRAVAMLSGFLSWCATRREYRGLVNREAARGAEIADLTPAKRRRTDAIEVDQLAPWFAGTLKLRNSTARAYLQGLVLTGARREELAGLRWADVDFRWRKLTIADKVGDTRTIPLAPYMARLLAPLPRATLADGTPNPYVFSSPKAKAGRIAEPRAPHTDVLADAGIPHVSIHGLRRTFALMGEAAGAPAGAIAQVMGHRPSAVAEGYKPRSIDALRPYLEQIEAFILGKAGVPIEAPQAAGGTAQVLPIHAA